MFYSFMRQTLNHPLRSVLQDNSSAGVRAEGGTGSPSSHDACLPLYAPALFSGLAMLGMGLEAFLRPDKELHLRVEARFFSEPAKDVLWSPRQCGIFLSWDVNLQKLT